MACGGWGGQGGHGGGAERDVERNLVGSGRRRLHWAGRGAAEGIPEHGHSHCSWGHLWHLLWPQAVPMLPQQSSCLVRPGRGLLPH